MLYNLDKTIGHNISQIFNGEYVPSYQEYRLLNACSNALNKGIFYSTFFYNFVINEMSDILNNEILKKNYKNTPTERGIFGMHVYYMRKFLESQREKESNLNYIKNNGLFVGMKIKNFKYSLDKFSTAVLNSIDMENGYVVLSCSKRGTSKKWLLTIGASRLSDDF